jgi:hypothetical protein
MSPKYRRSALLIVAAAVLAMPSASLAKPAGGGGGGDSGYCKTLKDRKDLYSGIANDRSEPPKVRKFYADKARGAASTAIAEGCNWTKPPAAAKRGGGTGTAPGPGSAIVFIKANPTGNQQQDEYCRGVAELINNAEKEGDAALLSGDEQGAAEWYALAEYFTERATRNGCRFMDLRHRVGGIQPPLTIALSPR